MKRASDFLFLSIVLSCGRDAVFYERPEPTSALVLLTLELPEGSAGRQYNEPLLADGPDSGAIRWRVLRGLPPGLELRSSGGPRASLFGTPSDFGRYPLVIEVSDAEQKISRTYDLLIRGANVAVEIEYEMLPEGQVDVPYSADITSHGGTAGGASWSIADGELPPGLTLSNIQESRTSISGVPRSAGEFTFTVEVRDDVGSTDREPFTIRITDPLRIITSVLASVTIGRPYAVTVDARGGVPPYRWNSDGLPDGLTLDYYGTPYTTLSGLARDPGTYQVGVRVFDSNEAAVEQEFELIVFAP